MILGGASDKAAMAVPTYQPDQDVTGTTTVLGNQTLWTEAEVWDGVNSPPYLAEVAPNIFVKLPDNWKGTQRLASERNVGKWDEYHQAKSNAIHVLIENRDTKLPEGWTYVQGNSPSPTASPTVGTVSAPAANKTPVYQADVSINTKQVILGDPGNWTEAEVWDGVSGPPYLVEVAPGVTIQLPKDWKGTYRLVMPRNESKWDEYNSGKANAIHVLVSDTNVALPDGWIYVSQPAAPGTALPVGDTGGKEPPGGGPTITPPAPPATVTKVATATCTVVPSACNICATGCHAFVEANYPQQHGESNGYVAQFGAGEHTRQLAHLWYIEPDDHNPATAQVVHKEDYVLVPFGVVQQDLPGSNGFFGEIMDFPDGLGGCGNENLMYAAAFDIVMHKGPDHTTGDIWLYDQFMAHINGENAKPVLHINMDGLGQMNNDQKQALLNSLNLADPTLATK
jgi:hypothetical protein